MVIETKILPPGACAVTVWPFILIHPDCANNASVILHEGVHYLQQQRWAIYGVGIGLLVWLALYLLALPIGWNYWRRKWETEAMLAEGRSKEEIDVTLRTAPYYLWWS